MPFFVAAGRKLALAASLALAGVVAAVSSGCTCGGANEAVSGAPSPSVSATSNQPSVTIQFDDTPAIVVPASQIAGRTTLESLLGAHAGPRATWRELTARGGKRYVQLEHLQRSYPEHELSLYRDAEGRLCFGAFRAVRPDMPGWMKQKLAEPSPSLVGVDTIELRTKERNEAPPEVHLELVLPGKDPVTLDFAKLSTLKETRPFRGNEDQKTKRGWLLRDVLGLSLSRAELAEVGEVVVTGGGKEQRVSDKDLHGDDVAALLKLNRRGALKLFVYRKGGPGVELDAVQRIEVVRRGAAKPPSKPDASAHAPPKASPSGAP